MSFTAELSAGADRSEASTAAASATVAHLKASTAAASVTVAHLEPFTVGASAMVDPAEVLSRTSCGGTVRSAGSERLDTVSSRSYFSFERIAFL